MQKLIDATFISGVSRVLDRDHAGIEDVANFLRFVGEILVTDHLLITVEREGPVFGPLSESISKIKEKIKIEGFFKYFDKSDVDYLKACDEAGVLLADDIILESDLPRDLKTLSPVFAGGGPDPVLESHQRFVKVFRGEQTANFDPILYPNEASLYVLSNQRLVSGLRQSESVDLIEDPSIFLKLTSIARAMIYQEIAGQFGTSYLPSTSRARILPHRLSLQSDQFGDETDSDLDKNDFRFTLASAVDSLVRIGSGDPNQIIEAACIQRKNFLPIREMLVQPLPGDALGARFDALNKKKELEDAFKELIDGRAQQGLAHFFNLNFVFFAFPTLTLKLSDIDHWWKRRKARKRTIHFADIVSRAKLVKRNVAYERLLAISQGVGIRDPEKLE